MINICSAVSPVVKINDRAFYLKLCWKKEGKMDIMLLVHIIIIIVKIMLKTDEPPQKLNRRR